MASKLQKTIDHWSRALLDLGRRNRMIHYRPSKRRALTVTEPSAEILFSKLALEDKPLAFRRPIDQKSAPRTHAVLSLLSMLGHPVKVTVGDLDYPGDYENAQATLSFMRSQYRLAHEEQGCHILYLSFGFVEWRDGKGGTKGSPFVRSPLILVPVELEQQSPAAPFTLRRRDDDIVVNPSLQLVLEKKGITLPTFEENNDSLDGFFMKIEELAEEHGWRVLREASLGLLSFQKISMYRDLEANRKRLLENPFVRAMAGEEGLFPKGDTILPDATPYRDTYQVLPADSSQQKAILAAKRGESFVMVGPPGTGKSQTITNIIAELLAEGKKILFVSGKNAALQVVYRRLQETGLASFCLPLHNHRANKRQILADISASLSMKSPKLSENDERDLTSLEEKREELNAYAEALRTPIEPLGYTAYEASSEIAKLTKDGAIEPLSIPTLPQSREEFLSLLTLASQYDAERAVYLAEQGEIPSALCGISLADTDRESFEASLTELGNAIITLSRLQRERGVSLDELPLDAVLPLGKTLQMATASVQALAARDGAMALFKAKLQTLDKVRRAKEATETVARDLAPIPDDVDPTLWQIELQSVMRSSLRDGVLSKLVPTGDANELVASRRTLVALLDELISLNRALAASHKAISDRIALPISDYYKALFGLCPYIPDLSEEIFVDASWTKETVREEDFVKSCQKRAEAVIEIEQKIVAKWRYDVLEINYKQLRDKFRDDIGGLFRFIGVNARRDVRRVLMGYTLTGDAPSDGEISELFDLLSDRSLAKRRFQTQEARLKALIGGTYSGVYTDFAAVLRGIAFVKGLSCELSALPAAIRAYLSLSKADQKEAYAALSKLYQTASSLKKAFDCVEGLMPLLESISNAEVQLTFSQNCLTALCEQYAAISRYTKRALSYSELIRVLEAKEFLERCHVKADDFENEAFWSALSAAIPLTSDGERELSVLIGLLRSDADKTAAALLLSQGEAAERAMSAVAAAFDAPSYRAMTLKEAKRRVVALMEELPKLSGFSPLGDCYRAFRKAGYESLLSAYEAGECTNTLENTLRFSVFTKLLERFKEENTAFTYFSRARLTKTASSFATLDNRFLTARRKKIVAMLAKTMPQGEREWRGEDELSILEHENAKRRGFMPLRKLFGKIPNLLLTLKPCLMMSPLSVSYFLEKESYTFDLVIFDEASQLFPEDAIGAISRGKQVIVVGDPKQLPPTDFFATRNDEGEEDEEDDGADEISPSILESAMTTLPKHKLLWHYRSRYESLIAFSNHKIYSGELVTFPSPGGDGKDTGIEYHYIPDGMYETGKGQNQKEAEAAVSLVLDHILHHPDRSLGIIAFGKKQQRAIEEAITQFRLDNPEYEDFFGEDRDEPFFVKNLETVQGDERDTIIFSIGYGKNQKGKFLMNFGPLTKLGGERRLNVAITRAKHNVKLIGSVMPQDFNLAATDAEGVHLLRAYIDYAIHKEKALSVPKAESVDAADGFLSAVEAFLVGEGYTVKRQFGTSLCRVELAVFHPEHKSAIAGLMTDGEAYQAAVTARDREHLRYGILKKMGWRLYSLYAPAWAKDAKKEKALLLDFIKNGQKEQSEIESTPLVALEGEHSEGEETVAHESLPETPYGFARYQAADWARAPLTSPYDKARVTLDRMRYLLEEEAPIHKELLFRRLVTSFRSGKLTESVKKTLEEALGKLIGQEFTIDAAEFIWRAEKKTPTVRIPPIEGEARAFEHIPKEELAEAMLVILKNAYGATPDSLYHELCHVYGCDRMTQKIRTRCEEALFFLLMSEKVRLVDGKIKVIA